MASGVIFLSRSSKKKDFLKLREAIEAILLEEVGFRVPISVSSNELAGSSEVLVSINDLGSFGPEKAGDIVYGVKERVVTLFDLKELDVAVYLSGTIVV